MLLLLPLPPLPTTLAGIVYVDLKDNLSRHPKASAHWLSRHFFTPAPKPTFTAQQRQAAADQPSVAKASQLRATGGL